MHTHANKTAENKSDAVARNFSQENVRSESSQLIDNRPQTLVQRRLQAVANNSPRAVQLKAFQEMADNSAQVKQLHAHQNMRDSSGVIQKEDEGYEADVEDNDEPAGPLTFGSLENLLNTMLGANWCYVGGYACNLWFTAYGLENDVTGDIELSVSADRMDEVNRAIRNMADIWDDESPTIDGLTLTIFSGNEDQGEKIGTARVLKPEKLISIYDRTLMGAAMKERLKGLTEEEKAKNAKRKDRVSKLKQVIVLKQ